MADADVGIPGTVIVMTAPHASMGVDQSMFSVGTRTLLRVPLGFGANGRATNSWFTVLGVPHSLTVDFYAWTPGTRTFTGLTSMSLPLPDVVVMGSFALTGSGGGMVTLVAPTKLTVIGRVADRKTASYTTLKLYFVPEPGTLLLLASAAACLALVGRRQPD
jgi:hypothetical protein